MACPARSRAGLPTVGGNSCPACCSRSVKLPRVLAAIRRRNSAGWLDRFSNVLGWLLVIRRHDVHPVSALRGLWEYTGISDLCRIVAAVIVSTAVFFLVLHWGFPISPATRDPCFSLINPPGRCFVRSSAVTTYRGSAAPYKGNKRVLIFGAGDAGEMIVRDMQNRPCGYGRRVRRR